MGCGSSVDLADLGFEIGSLSLGSIVGFGFSCEGWGMCFRQFRLF